MLNVNTAYKFDPNEGENRVDGTDQSQINLAALAARGVSNGDLQEAADKLQSFRCGIDAPNDIETYKTNVIREENTEQYTPFDIGDELKLRNRYIINDNKIHTRIEELWTKAFDWGKRTPDYNEFPKFESTNLPIDWVDRIRVSSDPNRYDSYDYRHLATTYNLDRTIDPYGVPQLYANDMNNIDDIDNLLTKLNDDVPSGIDLDDEYAQILANIIDFGDNDSNMTVINGKRGFERPCIFISEVVHKVVVEPKDEVVIGDEDPNNRYHSYGIELSKVGAGDMEGTDEWKLQLNLDDDAADEQIILDPNNFSGRYYVILIENEDNSKSLNIDSVDYNDPIVDGATNINPDLPLTWKPLSSEINFNSVEYNVYITDINSDANDTLKENAYDLIYDANSTEQDSEVDFYNLTDEEMSIGSPSTFLGLTKGRTYYWRVDDVNSGGEIRTGEIWTFTTWKEKPIHIYDVNLGVNEELDMDMELLRKNYSVDYFPDNIEDFSAGYDSLIEDVNTESASYVRSCRRDISHNRWIKRLWMNDYFSGTTLGHWNDIVFDNIESVRAFPRNHFENIGEIGMVFERNPLLPYNIIRDETDIETKLDLTDPNMQRLFNYLRIQDNLVEPDDANTVGNKIKGRININTAPWYVIAQLPWINHHTRKENNIYDRYALARALVAYRDKLMLEIDYTDRSDVLNLIINRDVWENEGFRNIGELANVINQAEDIHDIRHYGLDSEDNIGVPASPDVSVGSRTRRDGYTDDAEEYNLLFSRISDLVTVRSDVFTAYITVRLGRDGPQRRAVAILDRSEATNANKGKVKILAIHPAADPR
jgi:hypothetical protein